MWTLSGRESLAARNWPDFGNLISFTWNRTWNRGTSLRADHRSDLNVWVFPKQSLLWGVLTVLAFKRGLWNVSGPGRACRPAKTLVIDSAKWLWPSKTHGKVSPLGNFLTFSLRRPSLFESRTFWSLLKANNVVAQWFFEICSHFIKINFVNTVRRRILRLDQPS